MKSADIQAIASAVATAVTTSLSTVIAPKAPVIETEVTDQVPVTYTSPSAEAYHDAEATLIRRLSKGGNEKLMVGRRGAQLHNEVIESLNALHDIGRDRKIWSKGFTVR